MSAGMSEIPSETVREQEAAREKETFRYDCSSLITGSDFNPSSTLPVRSSPDLALTAFALLAVLKFGASRALISFFDSHTQHVVAEATPSLSLASNAPLKDLWFCGHAVPRASSLCEHVLVPEPDDENIDHYGVSVVGDLCADPRFCHKEYKHAHSTIRFYAGVPIRTRRGINIGVLCVIGDEPRDNLDGPSRKMLWELSKTIMNHLETKRSLSEHSRADRMVHGVGSFVEGNTDITGLEPMTPAFTPFANHEALTDGPSTIEQNDETPILQWDLQEDDQSKLLVPAATWPRRRSRQWVIKKNGKAAPESHKPSKAPANSQEHLSGNINNIYSRGANIIKESIEVSGVLFLDIGVSFADRSAAERTVVQVSRSDSNSSDENTTTNTTGDACGTCRIDQEVSCCSVLGFSNTSSSSLNADPTPDSYLTLPQKGLRRLMKRYPKGKIFSYDQGGSCEMDDGSGGEGSTVIEHTTTTAHPPFSSASPSNRHNIGAKPPYRRQYSSRWEIGTSIGKMFPGVRSVAFIPLWDQQKQRWSSGLFAYTNNPMRVLTTGAELSYLAAFGTVIMSEISRLDTMFVEKSKTDVLNSLSHELRSPLHGIVLGAELLHDTSLDAFQEEMLHSVEICGRTLLDTVDHLLDWTKINNFIAKSDSNESQANGAGGPEGRGMRLQQGNSITIEAGMMSIVTQVDVDILAEEVVETVYTGYIFEKLSASQLLIDRNLHQSDAKHVRQIHNTDAKETITAEQQSDSDGSQHGDEANLEVSIDIDPTKTWLFYTQPGALRRIIMNLVGNSLKYTKTGFVKITLDQPSHSEACAQGTSPASETVRITVADSGTGISKEFLQNRLFVPFSQENTLSSGAGLGLSLVKQIATRLGGCVRVQSQLGKGTMVSVSLPLERSNLESRKPSLATVGDNVEFEGQVNQLRGLYVLTEFSPNQCGDDDDEDLSRIDENRGGGTLRSEKSQIGQQQGESIARTCRGWLRMKVIEASERNKTIPDVIICNEAHLDELDSNNKEGNRAKSIPFVVICRNAMIAGQLATSARFSTKAKTGVFAFISQPVGPRKLAKILAHSFQRRLSIPSGDINSNMNMPNNNSVKLSLRGHDTQEVEVEMNNSELGPGTWQSMTPSSPPIPLTDERGGEEQEQGQECSSKTNNKADSHQQQAGFLLVDDNAINLKILASFIQKLGLLYRTATDGKQAVDIVCTGTTGTSGTGTDMGEKRRSSSSSSRFKCIFMDISMPVMDGFDASYRIREFERKNHLPPTPIFALTGLASAESQQQAFASGIDLFLSKPVRFRELSQILTNRGLI